MIRPTGGFHRIIMQDRLTVRYQLQYCGKLRCIAYVCRLITLLSANVVIFGARCCAPISLENKTQWDVVLPRLHKLLRCI
jgi:hypothetical protein